MSHNKKKSKKRIEQRIKTVEKKERALERKVKTNPANQLGPLLLKGPAFRNIVANVVKQRIEKSTKFSRAHAAKTHAVMDPEAVAYAKVVDSPLSANLKPKGKPVNFPITNGKPPCRSMPYTKAIYADIVMPASGFVEIFLYPEGNFSPADQFEKGTTPQTVNATTHDMGPLKSATYTANEPLIGYYYAGVSGDLTYMYDTTAATNTSSWYPIEYVASSVPFVWQGTGENGFRVIGSEVAITYTGDLEGAVGKFESFQTFDFAQDGESERAFMSDNHAYKVGYFSDKRTQTAHWRPNCETPEWTVGQPLAPVTTVQPCRWRIRIKAPEGTTYTIQGLTVFRLTAEIKHTEMAADTISSNAPEVKSAMVSSFNSEYGMSHHVAAHFLSGHPILKEALSIPKDAIEDVLEGPKAAAQALEAVGKALF
jgi:hypothetical protein